MAKYMKSELSKNNYAKSRQACCSLNKCFRSILWSGPWQESLLSTRAIVAERWKPVLGTTLIEIQEFNEHYKTNYWYFCLSYIWVNCLAQKMKKFCFGPKLTGRILGRQPLKNENLATYRGNSLRYQIHYISGWEIGIGFRQVCLI